MFGYSCLTQGINNLLQEGWIFGSFLQVLNKFVGVEGNLVFHIQILAYAMIEAFWKVFLYFSFQFL